MQEITVSSELDDLNNGIEVFRFKQMEGTEELGRLFQYDVELLSDTRITDLSIDGQPVKFKDILGTKITIKVLLDSSSGSYRHFNGYVTEFQYLGYEQTRYLYQATLRPWLWFLTKTKDCRVFQDKNAPTIINYLFYDFGFNSLHDYSFGEIGWSGEPVMEGLKGAYQKKEYCAQIDSRFPLAQ